MNYSPYSVYSSAGLLHFKHLRFDNRLAVLRQNGRIFGISTEAKIVAYMARDKTDRGELGFTCKWEPISTLMAELNSEYRKALHQRGNRVEKIGKALDLINKKLASMDREAA